MTQLIVTHEDDDVDEFRFDADHSPITLGRRTSNDVCIASPSVSGNHARIILDADGVWIEDLNSTNGTFINGRLISRRRLEHGDDIAIGKVRVTWLGWAGGSASGSKDTAADTTDDPLQPYAERLSARDDNEQAEASGEPPAQRRRFDDLLDADNDENTGSDDDGVAVAEPREDIDQSHDTAVAARPVTVGRHDTAAPARPEGQTVALTSTPQVANPDTAAAPAPAEPEAEAEVHPLDDVEDVAIADDTTDGELFDATLGKAALEIRNGAKSGQTLAIDKPVTTLGRPGIQIAAIMRKPDGYFLMHVESDENADRPTLNDDAIGDDPVPLRSGDELRVAGVDVQFTLS